VGSLLGELEDAILERLEIDVALLLDSRGGRRDPGVDAWLAHDAAQDTWRIAATIQSVPLGEHVMSLQLDDEDGGDLRRRIAHTMSDLRKMAVEPRCRVDAPAP
jgi:hypothetical protein